MTIGEIITKECEARGTSLYWISKETGIKYDVLWRIVRERVKTPRYETIVKIADVLNLDISSFNLEESKEQLARKAMTTPYRLSRERAGWSRSQAAEELGVETKTLRRWESGETQPSIRALIKMSRMYDTTVDHLVGADLELYQGRRCELGAPCKCGKMVDFCCRDCPDADICLDPCYNDPARCGQVKGGAL